jgi:hypothetical protein
MMSIRASFPPVQAEPVEAARPGFDKLSPNGFSWLERELE